jgi:hypothetical protein
MSSVAGAAQVEFLGFRVGQELRYMLGPQEALQLGPRTVDAWRLEADSPVDAVYVDGNGRILRIDLEPQRYNPRRLHIRLLASTEY